VLLNPNLDFDGDLLSSPLPRRQRVAPQPGRGYLVNNGEIQLVQLAQPARVRRSASRRRRAV
jgi:S-DNA-T family DNA segregation ATPase FtsK/SpoIIIE